MGDRWSLNYQNAIAKNAIGPSVIVPTAIPVDPNNSNIELTNLPALSSVQYIDINLPGTPPPTAVNDGTIITSNFGLGALRILSGAPVTQ